MDGKNGENGNNGGDGGGAVVHGTLSGRILTALIYDLAARNTLTAQRAGCALATRNTGRGGRRNGNNGGGGCRVAAHGTLMRENTNCALLRASSS